ncbi:formyltetrahydrofolate deformylase [Ectothiorhodospiraceae bacterium WFHF3C12]|nr:formyltetrahydrofolate deformylase [Ectothiorhodospiraceae bacterium WFHF3C12]
MATKENEYILTVASATDMRIVPDITNLMNANSCHITELAQYEDKRSGRLFLRVVFAQSDMQRVAEVNRDLKDMANKYAMKVSLISRDETPRIILMVSHLDHCFRDLINRSQSGALNVSIVSAISNHETCRDVAQKSGIPYHYMPTQEFNQAYREEKLKEIFEETRADLVVLARYMQVLSASLCEYLYGRAINIHHSFLPAFKGARPYEQAYARGVKLIGATAHYVTQDLDEGPIIEQVVRRVSHADGPHDLAVTGRDSERVALAKAIRLHVDRRVFIDGNKTILFH